MAAFALGGLTVGVPTASAVVFVTSCSDSCSSNCELQNDLDCSGQSGITLNSGADLDMHGHSLTCSSSCPSAAVTMTASSSVVKNLSTGAESAISGAFSTGVNCAGKTSSEVTGIRIDLTTTTPTAVTGLANCARVDNNVIVNSGNSSQAKAISTAGVANSDFVTDNRFEGWGITFYLTTSTGKQIQIDGNQIILDETGGNEIMLWIPLGADADVTFESNSIYDHATAASYFVNTGNGTIATHAVYCDPAKSACSVSQCPECAQDAAPFPVP
jgi:hypothetical protein